MAEGISGNSQMGNNVWVSDKGHLGYIRNLIHELKNRGNVDKVSGFQIKMSSG